MKLVLLWRPVFFGRSAWIDFARDGFGEGIWREIVIALITCCGVPIEVAWHPIRFACYL